MTPPVAELDAERAAKELFREHYGEEPTSPVDIEIVAFFARHLTLARATAPSLAPLSDSGALAAARELLRTSPWVAGEPIDEEWVAAILTAARSTAPSAEARALVEAAIEARRVELNEGRGNLA